MSKYTFFMVSLKSRRMYSIVMGIMLLLIANLPLLHISKFIYSDYNYFYKNPYIIGFMNILGLFFLRFGIVRYFLTNFMWVIYSLILFLALIGMSCFFALFITKWCLIIGFLGSLFFYSGVLWYTYEIGQICVSLISGRG